MLPIATENIFDKSILCTSYIIAFLLTPQVKYKMGTKCFPYRPHDYVYDPIFTVGGPIDHYKAGLVAKMSTVKYQICPIFPNMFSDLPRHRRVQKIPRASKPIPRYKSLQHRKCSMDPALMKVVDVRGSDRAKFCCTIINYPPSDLIPYLYFPTFTVEKSDVNRGNRANYHIGVQTKYRESSAQTSPWEPPYKVIGKGVPEILKLDFLKWGVGLPAGVHEIELINRARIRRSWEEYFHIDNCDGNNTIHKFRDYIEAMERDEWAFREKEIQDIQNLRYELLERMLSEIHEKSNIRTEMKMKNFIDLKRSELTDKIEKNRRKTEREFRKIEFQQRGVPNKYRKMNIIDEYADYKSELYAPLLRHGENPKHRHEVIDQTMKTYKVTFTGAENFDSFPSWLTSTCRRNGKNLICKSSTKWTTQILKKLYQELKNLRKVSKIESCSLRKQGEVFRPEEPPRKVEGISDKVEEIYQASVLWQAIVKGRTTQMIIYEGRNRCRELINELKYSQHFLEEDKKKSQKEKWNVKEMQRLSAKEDYQADILKSQLAKLQGSVIGTLLDFLNKELCRLLEERKVHAACKFLERERYKREADEAGRRQKELRRRREHDEMFKQIVKVNQDTVDLYLKDIITEGMEFVSAEEAIKYVQSLADKIEQDSEESSNIQSSNDVEKGDMLPDLVYHFLLPEIEKIKMREKIKKQQHENLVAIHETVYSNLEELRKDDNISAVEEFVQEIKPDTTEKSETSLHILSDIINNLDFGCPMPEGHE